MVLTNNQIGRLQLLLEKINTQKYWMEIGREDKLELEGTFIDLIELFNYQELMKLSADLKDVYNSGKNMKLTYIKKGEQIMNTRCLTVFRDKEGEEIAVMYRQMDGYPTGHGQELCEFLNGMIITNGIIPEEKRRTANGMNCLTAQVVAHFKDKVGGFYLYPAGERNMDEEYVYTISEKEGRPFLEIRIPAFGDSEEEILFAGTPEEGLEMIKDLE